MIASAMKNIFPPHLGFECCCLTNQRKAAFKTWFFIFQDVLAGHRRFQADY